MRAAYKWLGHLIALGVLLQAMWIAFGFFAVSNKIDGGARFDKEYVENNSVFGLDMHWLFGTTVIPLLGLVLLVVSFFARVPGGPRWAGLTLLAIVLQVALAFIAFAAPAVGLLHGLNAFVILGLAELSARRAAGTEPAAGAPAPAAA